MMNNNTIYKNNQMRDAMVGWLQNEPFTFAFTANFNRPTNFVAAKKALDDWQRIVDRKVLGRKWNEATAEQRLFWVAFPEHPNSNLHYHMLVRAPVNPLKAQRVATKAWELVVPSCNLWASALEDDDDISRFASYATKDLWNGVGITNFVISDS